MVSPGPNFASYSLHNSGRRRLVSRSNCSAALGTTTAEVNKTRAAMPKIDAPMTMKKVRRVESDPETALL